jgi:hypothetical protein
MSGPLLDLVQRHGGEMHGRYALLPGPGHSRHDRSLSVIIGAGGRPVFHSFAGDDFRIVRAYLGLDATEGDRPFDPALHRKMERARRIEREAVDAERLTFCETVWRETVPAAGTAVEVYLRGRGLAGPIPAVVRFHPAAPLDYQGKIRAPAMVAVVQDKAGAACGLHTTAIRADGSGKAGPNARRMFGTVKGGAVRLTPYSERLAVAEGIETALSYSAVTGAATWACLSTAGLVAFEIPPGVDQLTIAADGDDAGLKAAADLADRARRHCDVIKSPAPAGTDWNDCLKGAC